MNRRNFIRNLCIGTAAVSVKPESPTLRVSNKLRDLSKKIEPAFTVKFGPHPPLTIKEMEADIKEGTLEILRHINQMRRKALLCGRTITNG